MNKNINALKYILFNLFLIFLANSCQQERTEHPLLLKANALMEHHPDSALIILENVQEPSKMKENDRALYALLLMQAADKNNTIHTDDSLIQIAVDYYKNGNDVYREAQAFYYLGCVYADMDNIVLSMDALLKAEDKLGQKYKNDRLMFLINSNLASQYRMQGFCDKAMAATRKTYNNCICRNDSDDILFSFDCMGSIFLLRNENDSALYYHNKALEIAELQSDSSWIAYFSNEISKNYLFRKDLYNAYQYTVKAINYEPDAKNLLSHYCDKGNLFYEMQEQDSARYYLTESLKSDNIKTQFLSSLTLFKIEKDAGNYKKAVEYIEFNNILADSIYTLNKQSEIAKLLNDHAITIHTKKLAFKEKKKRFYIIMPCVIVLILFVFSFMIIDKQRKSHIIKLQKQLMRNRAETIKANQQKENVERADTVSEIETLKKICIKNIQTSRELFKKKILYKEIHFIDRLNNNENSFPSKKRDNLKEAIYETFPDALLSLRDLYNLTSDDAFCCILYSLNFSNRTVAACMGVAEGAIKTRKSRLKNKIDEKLYTYILGL